MARANLILLLVLSLLVLISVAESKRFAVEFAEKKVTPLVCDTVYGAEEGDTCSSVAHQFKLSLDAFLAINPNVDCNSFFVGQWLCIED